MLDSIFKSVSRSPNVHLLTSFEIPRKTHEFFVSFYDVLRSVFSELATVKPRLDFFPQ